MKNDEESRGETNDTKGSMRRSWDEYAECSLQDFVLVEPLLRVQRKNRKKEKRNIGTIFFEEEEEEEEKEEFVQRRRLKLTSFGKKNWRKLRTNLDVFCWPRRESIFDPLWEFRI